MEINWPVVWSIVIALVVFSIWFIISQIYKEFKNKKRIEELREFIRIHEEYLATNPKNPNRKIAYIAKYEFEYELKKRLGPWYQRWYL